MGHEPLWCERESVACMQVPVTSHQTHKSDLLNNPEACTSLWFPEKSRSAKSKSKFPAPQKRAADNKQMGLALERLQADSSTKSNPSTPPGSAVGAQNLVAMAYSSPATPVRPSYIRHSFSIHTTAFIRPC